MTSLQYLRKYFDQLEQDFHIKYLEVMHDYEMERVHDLRVVMKKLNAFSSLLTYLNPDYDPRSFQGTLYIIHKKAGEVRNVQVEEKLIQKQVAKHHIHSKLQKRLTKLHKKVETEFREFESKHSLIAIRYDMEEVKKYIRQLHIKGLYKNIHAYFVLVINQINEQIKNKSPNQHDIRKDLKELLCNLIFLDAFPDILLVRVNLLW